MGEEEDEEGDGDPGPAAFDEEDVEEVGLARKVGRGEVRFLGVCLEGGIVGCVADGGAEQREKGAEGEEDRVG